MKDKVEEKGMGIGEEHAEERVEGKGKAQEGTKGEEKSNEREREDTADESGFDRPTSWWDTSISISSQKCC